jgi:alpha-1,2-mannosyltransferase
VTTLAGVTISLSTVRTVSVPSAAQRRFGLACWVLLAAACAYLIDRLLAEHLLDLRVYRSGAAALLHGGGIYQEHVDATDPLRTPLNFTYPPFAALLFTPFALLGWPVVVAGLTLAGVAALAYTVRLVLRHLRLPVAVAPAIVLGALLLGPVGWPQGTLVMGQVNLLLMAAVAADLLPGERRWRGALTGIATGVKLTPGIFLVYLALTGRRREAATGAAVAAGTGLLGLAVAPADSVLFWTRLWWDPAHVGDQAYTANQSLGGVVARLTGGHTLWLALVLLVGVGGLALARAAYRAGDELWGVLVTALTGLLVSPVSWQHHWVWAVPVAVVLFARGARAIGWCWLAVFALQPMWWRLPDAAGGGVAANAVALAGLALLAAAPFLVERWVIILARPAAIGSAVWTACGSLAAGSRYRAPCGRAGAPRRTTGWWWSTAVARWPRWARPARSPCRPTCPHSAGPGAG